MIVVVARDMLINLIALLPLESSLQLLLVGTVCLIYALLVLTTEPYECLLLAHGFLKGH